MTIDSNSQAASIEPQWLNQIKWNDAGLVPAIAQDAFTGRVLMMAWMNAESLVETVQTYKAVYYSRSRQKLWRKGESSGHEQLVKEIRLDCDGDTVLLLIEQQGHIACHTGRQSCFYLVHDNDQWQAKEPVLKTPEQMYGQ